MASEDARQWHPTWGTISDGKFGLVFVFVPAGLQQLAGG